MKRTKSSKMWLNEHVNDHYVHMAKAQGWRSRAAFKLQEIDERDHLFKPGMVVVDLGAAPGSWSQLAVRRVGAAGKVLALDLLEIEPIPGVHFILGDFTEDAVLEQLEAALEGTAVDLVICDIAPNISGIASVDQSRSIHLCELALDFAQRHLTDKGRFLVKVFQGSGFDDFRKALQQSFTSVQVRKPKASRDRSTEVYLLSGGLRNSGGDVF